MGNREPDWLEQAARELDERMAHLDREKPDLKCSSCGETICCWSCCEPFCSGCGLGKCDCGSMEFSCDWSRGMECNGNDPVRKVCPITKCETCSKAEAERKRASS